MSAGSPRRVFMTADAVGGVWTYTLDLARGLADHGVATTVAVLGPAPSPPQARAAAGIEALSLVETGLPLDWTAEDEAALRLAAREVARLAAASGADVVHLNSPALAALVEFETPTVVVCHSCVATWWSATHQGALPADLRWRSDLIGRGYRAADALVAPSRAFAEATAAEYGLSPPPTVVLNGRTKTGTAGGAAREPVVLTAGRLWDDGKNLATLDAAAALTPHPVLAAGPMAGPDGNRREFNHLRHLGDLSPEDLADQMSRAAVFASAALYEPFGLAVLEAAQAGCALVLADIATFRELWADAACFVPPRDPQAFADAVDALLIDQDRREALASAAKERAGRYTAAAMADGMMEVYAGVLGPRLQEAAA